jgi:hypothetical protein
MTIQQKFREDENELQKILNDKDFIAGMNDIGTDRMDWERFSSDGWYSAGCRYGATQEGFLVQMRFAIVSGLIDRVFKIRLFGRVYALGMIEYYGGDPVPALSFNYGRGCPVCYTIPGLKKFIEI